MRNYYIKCYLKYLLKKFLILNSLQIIPISLFIVSCFYSNEFHPFKINFKCKFKKEYKKHILLYLIKLNPNKV